MKRDMDLIREILLAVENGPERGIENFKIGSFFRDQIIHNIRLLKKAEYIEGAIYESDNAGVLGYRIFRLTWAGHDFLEACRDEGRWTKAKEIFGKLDGVTFDVIKQVLVELTMTAAKQLIPGSAL